MPEHFHRVEMNQFDYAVNKIAMNAQASNPLIYVERSKNQEATGAQFIREHKTYTQTHKSKSGAMLEPFAFAYSTYSLRLANARSQMVRRGKFTFSIRRSSNDASANGATSNTHAEPGGAMLHANKRL